MTLSWGMYKCPISHVLCHLRQAVRVRLVRFCTSRTFLIMCWASDVSTGCHIGPGTHMTETAVHKGLRATALLVRAATKLQPRKGPLAVDTTQTPTW